MDINRAHPHILSITRLVSEEEHLSMYYLYGLDLSSNGLSDVPLNFIHFQALETLFLTGNQLTTVPKVLRVMKSLTRLSLKSNRLTALDPWQEFPSSVIHLILTDNNIARIQSSFCGPFDENGDLQVPEDEKFSNLRKLMLAGNSFTAVETLLVGVREPENVQISCPFLRAVELIRVTRNRVTIDHLFHPRADAVRELIAGRQSATFLDRFTKLKWISFAGNPATRQGTKQSLMQLVGKLQNITTEVDCVVGSGLLGEGASGIVKRCFMGGRAVAVKFFKKVSSDGSGEDEVRVLNHVPTHRYIVAPIGFIDVDVGKFKEALPSVRAPFQTMLSVASGAAAASAKAVGVQMRFVGVCFPLILAKPLAKPPSIFTVSDDTFANPALSTIDDFALERDTEWPVLALWTHHGTRESPSVVTIPRSGYTEQVVIAATTELTARLEIATIVSLQLFFGVCEAVWALHRQGIVHADIYAHNIFFGRVESAPGALQLLPPSFQLWMTHRLENAINDTMWAATKRSSRFQSMREMRPLLTDFGASFQLYEPANGNPVQTVPASLLCAERRAVSIFVRDLATGILPLQKATEVANGMRNYLHGIRWESEDAAQRVSHEINGLSAVIEAALQAIAILWQARSDLDNCDLWKEHTTPAEYAGKAEIILLSLRERHSA
jgi:hypothetical protein